jgi:cell division protein FtsZ
MSDFFTTPYERADLPKPERENLTIKIIGVGGAGNNAVSRLHESKSAGGELVIINTDAQALAASPVPSQCLIGRQLTRGLSAGGDMEIGRQAAEADAETMRELLRGVDLLFIVAGLGGGTGSGVSPVLARLAEEEGALVIAFVTMPFNLEGARRREQADAALVALRSHCAAVIPLPNDMLLQEAEEDATVLDAFRRADDWMRRGIHAITTLLLKTGMINLDFSSLRKTLALRGGKTLFGLGSATGPDYVRQALHNLQQCPLLHTPEISRRADSLLVNIIGGADLSMAKVNEILGWVADAFGSRENTVLGAIIDDSIQQSVELCIIGATGVAVPRSNRAPVPATPVASSPENPHEASGQGQVPKAPVSPERPVHVSKLKKPSRRTAADQDEFDFVRIEEQRGFFDRTDRNWFDGEDLDVPTFLRKGIRIVR